MTKKRGLFSWFGKQDGTNQSTAETSPENASAQADDWDQLPTKPTPEAAAEPAETSVSSEAQAEAPSSIEPAVETQEVTPEPEQPTNQEPQLESVESAQVEATAQEAAQTETAEQQAPQDEADAATQAEPEEASTSFMSRLKAGLKRTRQSWGSGFVALFKGKQIDDELFEELEEQLLIADVGVATTTKLIDTLTQSASLGQLKDGEALYQMLRDEMTGMLKSVESPLEIESHTPYVILMVGVNGVGKTTTIGKLAKQFQAQGKSVMLAAGDTFRAAAVEQLQVWGERNQIPVVAQHTGADSASVLFDAVESAKARNVDVLIADTAGRLQNKAHLMDELKKVVRVMKKIDPNAPHEVMLTIDAGTGQNAISQAKLFDEAVGLTGITLTKLDGTAKGGVIFAVADQFKLPIRYIGVGEGIDDLRTFEADSFVEALFSQEES